METWLGVGLRLFVAEEIRFGPALSIQKARAFGAAKLYFAGGLRLSFAGMSTLRRQTWAVALFALLAGLPAARAADKPVADFSEIYELLRAHLPGMDESALNRAAVEGLVKQLHPQVTLLGQAAEAPASPNLPGVARASVIEGAFGYFRIGQVGAGLDRELAAAYQKLTATNKLKGLVLDLRFADGFDYAAAATTADWFFSTEQPLIDWGDGLRKSTAKSDALRLPVAVLVNAKTAGAAEALAGILRQGEVALLVGTNTAGQASMFKEFTLKNGRRLRLATKPITVGAGQPLPLTGLKADIQVDVHLDDEQLWVEDGYKVLTRTNRLADTSGAETNALAAGTNRATRRPNEAELVRMHRLGVTPAEPTNAPHRTTEAPGPLLQDPALVRAIDLLKGLSLVQPFRSI
jgi:hypothetical protein